MFLYPRFEYRQYRLSSYSAQPPALRNPQCLRWWSLLHRRQKQTQTLNETSDTHHKDSKTSKQKEHVHKVLLKSPIKVAYGQSSVGFLLWHSFFCHFVSNICWFLQVPTRKSDLDADMMSLVNREVRSSEQLRMACISLWFWLIWISLEDVDMYTEVTLFICDFYIFNSPKEM